MFLRPASINQQACEKHIMRQAHSAQRKLETIERELQRPGSGQLWQNRLTSPEGPTLRSQERCQKKSTQKLNQTQSSIPNRKLDHSRIISLSRPKKCECGGHSAHRDIKSKVKPQASCSLTQQILGGNGTALLSPENMKHKSKFKSPADHFSINSQQTKSTYLMSDKLTHVIADSAMKN